MDTQEELKAEIEKAHFARAARIAESLGLEARQLQDLQRKALWQLAAQYRNAAGTKKLALQYGVSKKDLEKLLRDCADEKQESEERSLEPCYDHHTSSYLAFMEWVVHLLKRWDKIP